LTLDRNLTQVGKKDTQHEEERGDQAEYDPTKKQQGTYFSIGSIIDTNHWFFYYC
jgi:hypothetical protein